MEERNSAEGSRDSASLIRRPIECAEEQWPQQIAMDVSTTGEAAVHRIREKALATVEPPLGLDEVEKQHAREVEEGQVPAVFSSKLPAERILHALERTLECPEEATA